MLPCKRTDQKKKKMLPISASKETLRSVGFWV